MNNLKEIPLHEFMQTPVDKKLILMRQAFSQIKNPLMMFQNWRASLHGWNVRESDIAAQLAVLVKEQPEDQIWETFSVLMSLNSDGYIVSSSDGIKKLTLARNNTPEKIAVIAELDYAARNRFAIHVAEIILEIHSNMRNSGLSIVDFSERMIDRVGECRWVETLIGWGVDKESLIGFFQRRVSWDYYKNPEGLYALATLSGYILADCQKQT